MDITVDTTRSFQNDLENFDKSDQQLILNTLEKLYKSLGTNNGRFFKTVRRVRRVALNGYESSLHVAKINERLRVFMAVDDDPIFERTIITLMKVTNNKDIMKTYKSVAESLLRSELALDSRG